MEPIRKRQLIQSEDARITLFTLKFQFIFDTHNDESYLTLKGIVMRIDKLNRRDHLNNKCQKSRIRIIYGSGVILFSAIMSWN